MRIPIAEKEVGVAVKCSYEKDAYVFHSKQDSYWINCGNKYYEGREMTWEEFNKFCPFRGRWRMQRRTKESKRTW